MSDNIGFDIGMSIARTNLEVDYQKERQRMQRAVSNAGVTAIAEQAQKNATRAVANQIINEIAALQRGESIERRLSDPDNVDNRLEDFVDTADAEMNRISDGKLNFDRASVATVKRSEAELKTLFETNGVKLEPVFNRRPR